MKTQPALETGSGLPLEGEQPAPTPKKKRTRNAAPKDGLVERLQTQLKEARKISKATAIIAVLSEFGCNEITAAINARRKELNPPVE